MANWKLTPERISENLFGITPEWTSGAGCYQVKRFSSVFPLFLNGETEFHEASKLLRWSSKLAHASDLCVYIEVSGRAVPLFSAQPFVVEFFKLHWLNTSISGKMIYLTKKMEQTYGIVNAKCGLADSAEVLNLFKHASKTITSEVSQANQANTQALYNICVKNRDKLQSLITSEELVAFSLNNTAILFNKLKTKEFTPKKTRALSELRVSKKVRIEPVTLLKNKEITPVNSSADIEWVKGRIQYKYEGHKLTYTVFKYGVFSLISIVHDSKSTFKFPVKTLLEAKRFISLIENNGSDEIKRLCIKATSAEGVLTQAVLGLIPESAADYLTDIWSGTPIGYNLFISSKPIKTPLPPIDLIQNVCKLLLKNTLKQPETLK